MNISLCESSGKEKFNAAKARRDAREIVCGQGYKDIILFHNGYFKPFIVCEIVWGCIKAVACAGKGDTVFIQYPYYPSAVQKLFFGMLRFGKRIKKYKVTMLIHDVIALRQRVSCPDDDLAVLAAEVNSWSWVDRVICHNESMRSILMKASPFDRYAVLGAFDYLYDGPVCERHYSEQLSVVIAGCLAKEKSGYIYKLEEVDSIRFELFGTDYTGTETERVRYRGKYPPDELISHLDGQFGLVWDGDSVDSCRGDTGEYLRWNDPFKFSMYIAAGLPVIVWEGSALAGFVKENGIGLCVGSLYELCNIPKDISSERYGEMCENISRIRTNMTSGAHLRGCL